MQRFGAYLRGLVLQHLFHLRNDLLIAGIVQQTQGSRADGWRGVLEQSAQRGMPARLAAKLEKAEAVE